MVAIPPKSSRRPSRSRCARASHCRGRVHLRRGFLASRRQVREDSTALSAPINYGPGLKTLGWLQPDAEREGAWAATELAEPAIVAFEAEIAAFLHHPAFCKFGPVSIANTDVDQLKEAWALERPTEAERLAMKRSLMGDAAGQRRRDGIKLAIAAVYHLKSSTDVLAVRRTMCGPPTDFVPPPELQLAAQTWRSVQVRQAFRLALEASLHWILRQLDRGPMTTGALAKAFLDRSGDATATAEWLSLADGTGPADWIDRLERGLASADEVALLRAIRTTLGMSLAEAPEKAGSERDDRLPLARAAREARRWENCRRPTLSRTSSRVGSSANTSTGPSARPRGCARPRQDHSAAKSHARRWWLEPRARRQGGQPKRTARNPRPVGNRAPPLRGSRPRSLIVASIKRRPLLRDEFLSGAKPVP